jgi:hypothetical protein
MAAPEVWVKKYKGLNEMLAQAMVCFEGQNRLEERLFVGIDGNQLCPLVLETVLLGVLQ